MDVSAVTCDEDRAVKAVKGVKAKDGPKRPNKPEDILLLTKGDLVG